MVIKHKKFGEFTIKNDPLLQKHIEAYFRELKKLGAKLEDISAPEYAGNCVRAAVNLNWFDKSVNVDEALPAKILWLNKEIQNYIGKAMSDEDPN